MEQKVTLTVSSDDAGMRLDKFLLKYVPDKTRSSLQKIIQDGLVKLGETQLNKNYKLRRNDQISIVFPLPKQDSIIAENIPLDIVYEDNDLIVVNKPKGMVVHPAAGNYEGTLVNALMFYYKDSLSGINGQMRPGIVHRIDKDTSGLLIVAKNDSVHLELAKQIKAHSFKRIYEAIVYGRVKHSTTINQPIGRSQKDRKKMCITDKNSRQAITNLEVIQNYEQFTHVRLKLETGRTHQIRVHMASIGHPVAGDAVYGPKKCITELKGQCLHARSIGFVHPTTNEYMEFTSELPKYFTKFLYKINNSRL